MDKRIEDFLNHATEGLHDDTELQLDARAELASHVEEKLNELHSAGVGEEEAIQEAVKSMGEPIELAADLFEANRRRMNFRAQLRFFMRFALVPVALLSTLWATDLDSMLRNKLSHSKQPTSRLPPAARKLSDEEKFLFLGDPDRQNISEREKSIWESDPTNLVYFGNYFGATAREWREDTRKIPDDLLDTARKVDPGNALYDYLEALKIMGVRRENYSKTLNDTISFDSFKSGNSLETAELPSYEVLDRDRLDQAMALIEKALNRPLRQYYAEEMLRRRLSMLPEPERMIDQMAYIVYSAENYRPSIGPLWMRHLSRLMRVYGDLLLKEGDTQRATEFLSSWEKMPRQIFDGRATSLLDTCFAMAVINTGYSSAAIYQAHGFEKEAKQIAAKARFLNAPFQRWRTSRNNPGNKTCVEQYGSSIADISLSNFGKITSEELAPSRRLEYAVATEGITTITSIALLVAILGCGIVGLRWRLTKKGRAIPILLIPTPFTFVKVLFLGVVCPGLLFLLLTRFVPWSGHSYSFRYGTHKLMAEFGLLIMAILILPFALGEKAIRKRCVELGIPTASLASRKLKPAFLICAAILIALWFVPANTSKACFWLSILLAGVTVSLLLFGALGGIVQGLMGREKHGLYYGSLFRSLIPLLAGTALLLNLASRPILFTAEQKYIHNDPLYDANSPYFVTRETDAAKELQRELLEAIEKAESLP